MPWHVQGLPTAGCSPAQTFTDNIAFSVCSFPFGNAMASDKSASLPMQISLGLSNKYFALDFSPALPPGPSGMGRGGGQCRLLPPPRETRPALGRAGYEKHFPARRASGGVQTRGCTFDRVFYCANKPGGLGLDRCCTQRSPLVFMIASRPRFAALPE